MRKLNYLFACVAAAALVACGGGGGDDTTTVAADAAPVAVNKETGAAAAQALAGKPISFPAGVPDFGTTTATTLTLTAPAAAGAAPTFAVAADGGSASGDLTFGSCIFTVKQSTFVAPHPLQLGAVRTISDCKIDLNTANVAAEGGSATVEVTVALNGTTSAPVTTTVVIQSNGDILVGGAKITSVQVTQVTGGA